MSKDAEIEMMDENFDNVPKDEANTTAILAGIEDKNLKIYTWREDDIIFLMYNNVTIQMPEDDFCQLSKVINKTIKAIFGLSD